MFQFILIDGLAADNHLAERSIRSLVIIRKIRDGSRSDGGTKTRIGLTSRFETWQACTQNPLAVCLALLRQAVSTSA